jgi:hypothetical protein
MEGMPESATGARSTKIARRARNVLTRPNESIVGLRYGTEIDASCAAARDSIVQLPYNRAVVAAPRKCTLLPFSGNRGTVNSDEGAARRKKENAAHFENSKAAI